MAEPATPVGPRVLTSALRCLSLLQDLAQSSIPLGVSEIARRTGRDRGTVYHQLQTLVAAGWVEQLPSAAYRLTLRAVEVGSAALEQADLGSRTTPILTSLAASSGETSSLAVVDRHDALIAQRIESTHPVKADIKVGTRMPLALSASGRILVAFMNDDERRVLVSEGAELPSQETLQRARETGYAFQRDELMVGMSSVAVQVTVGSLGRVALALTSPSSRFDLERSLGYLNEARSEIARLTGSEV